ncbi:MAG: asmA family protein, partial [bacterium]|nr:asmA family protein [bacterium]
HNFSRPQIELRARSSYLDTADLLPGSSPTARGKPAAAPQPATAGRPPNAVARLNGHAALTVTRGLASGIAFEGLQADVAMRDGAVRAERLVVGAWGGQIAGNGSEVDLADAHGRFRLVGQVSGVDVAQMLARFSGGNVMAGRLSAQLDARGRGTTVPELERTMTGTLVGDITQAKLLAFDLGGAVASKLSAALPFHLPTQKLEHANDLGTVHGEMQFADGAIVLTKPLTANTAEGPLELRGRMFFDGRLDLTGTLQLSPAAASAMLANRVKPTAALPLSLHIGGDIHHPALGIGNISDVANTLVRSGVGLAGGAAGKMLEGTGIENAVPGLKIPGRQQATAPGEQQKQKQAPAQPQDKGVQQQIEQEATQKLKGLLRR